MSERITRRKIQNYLFRPDGTTRHTQRELAEEMGCTPSYICQFLKKYPDAMVVYKGDRIDHLAYTVVMYSRRH